MMYKRGIIFLYDRGDLIMSEKKLNQVEEAVIVEHKLTPEEQIDLVTQVHLDGTYCLT